jgi:hypothetical protein
MKKSNRKNKSVDQNNLVNNSKKYFGCFEYRKDKDSEYQIIISLCNRYDKMFKFPIKNIPCDPFGIYSQFNCFVDVKEENFVGCNFLYGGEVTGEIPSYWVGDKIKVLSKNVSEFPIPSFKEYMMGKNPSGDDIVKVNKMFEQMDVEYIKKMDDFFIQTGSNRLRHELSTFGVVTES